MTAHDEIVRVSPTAEKWLHEWADSLADGTKSLAQLPPAVTTLYLLGYEQGRAATNHELEHRIARLSYERDTWYFCANNPGKTPGDFMTAQTAALWRNGDA